MDGLTRTLNLALGGTEPGEPPEWAADTDRRMAAATAEGFTFEQIAEQVGQPPTWVYARLHPHKTADQLRGWAERRHPDLAGWLQSEEG
jgi:hypothetical protein